MMKYFFGIFLLLTLNLPAQNSYRLIPFPNDLVTKEGRFEFRNSLTLSLPPAFRSELDLFREIFESQFCIKVLPAKNAQLEFRQNKQLPDEAYTLSVSDKRVIAEASSKAGCFWAFQTIRQLITLNGDGSYTIPNCDITDKPAFRWRAFLLDEARYFKGKEAVLKLLDEMALLKMNTFHWHLTDDAGWRIEIKKYPLLTKNGAWRDSSQLQSTRSTVYDPHPHGGFYTREDIKEIVGYAAGRHIMIVPEIEMPGHMSAAISAYPWLGSSGEPIRVPVAFGIKKDVLNVADDRVYGFLEDVLKEVMELFPGKVINICGDEVPYDYWKKNPQITTLMKEKGFQNYSDLHVYFSNRISEFLEKNGRHLMGGNDILGKNIHDWAKEEANSTQSLSKNSIIQFWKGDPVLLNDAINNGYSIVNTYHLYTYLDYTYKRIPLDRAYDFNPVPQEITGKSAEKVLGLACLMWGEWIPSVRDMHRQTFPRIAAYAETGWTLAENKDYRRFLDALENLRRHWDRQGIFHYQGTDLQSKDSK